jgi:hypothetical protein
MAIRNPTPYLQQREDHSAQNDRLVIESVVSPGGGVKADAAGSNLVVSPGGGMNVTIEPGVAFVPGIVSPFQGMYLAYNDASATVSLSAAPGSGSRIDLIGIMIEDAEVRGTLNTGGSLRVITGTPTTGVPQPNAVPTNAAGWLTLARVTVPAGATSIIGANIARPAFIYAADGLGSYRADSAASFPGAAEGVREGAMGYVVGNPQVGGGPYLFNGTTWDAGPPVNPQRVYAYRSLALNFTTGVWTTFSLNAEKYDVGGLHDTVTLADRIIIRQPGLYLVSAAITYDLEAAGNRGLLIKLNAAGVVSDGSTLAQSWIPGSPAGFVTVQATREWPMVAGDYLQLFGIQTSGATLAVNGLAPMTFMAVRRVAG